MQVFRRKWTEKLYLKHKFAIVCLQLAWIHKDRHNLLTLHDQVITRNPRISIHHNNYRSWWLEIKDVKLEDSGHYMCQINTAPMISQTRHLEVVVPPSFDEEYTSSDLDVREGADVNLRCRADGSPTPVIKWRREEDKDIILGSKRVPSVEGEFLKLTRTSRLSMGAYLCIASNGVRPSVSKRIMLNDILEPLNGHRSRYASRSNGALNALYVYIRLSKIQSCSLCCYQ
ncbi:UNVERIFIED_CONTAM: Protein CEPU-1 [Trichonephila clavipes]